MSRQLRQALAVLSEPSEIIELRALKGKATVAGYFDDHDRLASEAARLDKNGYAVYVTINPVDPALLARAANRIESQPAATTSDGDITRRRWLPIDFDPVRPSGVSSTREEKKAALLRAREVRDYLADLGWPELIVADSGNGAHLLIPVDLPNDREALELIKGVLEAISFLFSDEQVNVDTSVANAARIWKLYGTTARKGDDTDDRPHRLSKLIKIPEELEVVDREKLEALSGTKPIPDPRRNGHKNGFDPGDWMSEHHVPVKREGPWGRGGHRWILSECPWNGHADNSAYVVQHPTGAIAAGCHHDSCQGYGWRELRGHYEPEAYERRTGPADGAGVEVSYAAAGPKRPELASEALYGLPGEIVETILPHTEAHPAALLLNTLVGFGNAVGRGAYLKVGADRHHLNLFALLVGRSSKARKGASWGFVRDLLHAADPEWCENRVLSGLSSGEGLIYQVRDPVVIEKDGQPIVIDAGVDDKRLCAIEGEFAGPMKAAAREGSILSPVLRQAWDGGRLATLTKNSPLRASDPHISLMGHTTQEEFRRRLTEVEAANGFLNRFMIVSVERSKALPFGGEWNTVDVVPLVRRLGQALEFGKTVGELRWGASARGAWTDVYEPLSEGKPGLFGAATARAEAQVVRLASVYAVMDRSRTIEYQHLEAALGLWQYCEDSARYIFGNSTGDPVADKIEETLKSSPEGLTRDQIRELFHRNQSSSRIDRALATLLDAGRARREMEQTGGRPAERWFAQ